MTVKSKLLRLVIGLKTSRQFITNEPITTSPRDFSRDFSKLHAIATNLDWLVALFAPAVIGRSNYFGTYFTTLN